MSAFHAAQLRRELAELNREYARARGMAHVESYGDGKVVVYQPEADELTHGNFHPLSYAAIRQTAEWSRRLNKVHSQAKKSLPKTERKWMELDSSTSSDALLMNVFCFPCVLDSFAVQGMLGIETPSAPQFGVKARVPLKGDKFDRTEVDMRVADLLVESKLTETDFQCRDVAVLDSYRDFKEVFDLKLLPRRKQQVLGYQLVRNVLAANALNASFCVFLDARRPDLLEEWYGVMRSVKTVDMRTRCKVLTWQELSTVLPESLQNFLAAKYGIVA